MIKHLREQFIQGLGDKGITSEILRGVLAFEDFNDATRERVLLLAQRVQKKEALNSVKETKEFDTVRHSTQKHGIEVHRKQKLIENCK